VLRNVSWTPVPVVDGTVLSDRPTQLINQGKFCKVPVLVGATTDENFFFSTSLRTDFNMWWPAMTNLTAIEQIYPSSDFANETIRAQTANGETMFRCPVRDRPLIKLSLYLNESSANMCQKHKL